MNKIRNLDKVYVWYDAEGDYLEVDLGEPRDGDTAMTAHNGVYVKLDADDNLIGFSIIGVSTLQENAAKPFEVELTPNFDYPPKGRKRVRGVVESVNRNGS